jgi:hypothetical protein
LALIQFAITLFLSAFILFLVQPLIGKLVLPRLGGTPQVWNTCMVFFQMMLLLGYFYTHAISTRLKARHQLIVHGLLLLSPFLIFMIAPFWSIKTWPLPLGTNPIVQALIMLFAVVGIPFFVVSTSAPLLQKWFGLTGHPAAKDPYFLYGASNLGSMLSLLLYPAGIEPFLWLNSQAMLWMIGYGSLVAMVFVCIGMVWSRSNVAVRPESPHHEPKPVTATGGELAGAIRPAKAPLPGIARLTPEHSSADEVSMLRRLRWIALAAVPSSLMLGITSHITTDLSPVPLFWLVPLALYLLSFILVFMRWPIVWTDNPHTVMVLLQPISIVLMLFFEMVRGQEIWLVITANVVGFFLTTMACHGELAKDRPSTTHLTDFYLMMSIGGVCGGILNAIIAPLFPFVFEFNLALIAACLLRPTIPFGNFLDDAIAKMADTTPEPTRGPKARGKIAPVLRTANEPTPQLSYGIDVAVGLGVAVVAFVTIFVFGGSRDSGLQLIAYLVPLFLALIFMFRPVRFGLAIAGVLLANEAFTLSNDAHSVAFRTRSYFGAIMVRKGVESGGNGKLPLEFKTLMHGTTDHGRCYKAPEDADPSSDFSRLATTYYTRKCPVGVVMERYNWFGTDETSTDKFQSDLRMPASLVGSAAFGAFGLSPMPLAELVEAWSEPPYATIGLGTGTMASYARPFQHCHFYEIDEQIRKLSLPAKDDGSAEVLENFNPHFTYLKNARLRGAAVQVLMGDARQRMALPYENYYEAEVAAKEGHPFKVPNGGPENFYHMMVVDAFSSDAIPAHLLTKEAFEMYFKHLTQDGILCVHTSNRHVRLPLVVADVAESLGLVCKRGHFDPQQNLIRGATSSEWVMVSRKAPKLPTFEALLKMAGQEDLGYVTEAGYAKAGEAFAKANAKENSNPKLQALFMSIDTNGDGKITNDKDNKEWDAALLKMKGGDFGYLAHLRQPDDYPRIRNKETRQDAYWSNLPTHDGRYTWTDDYYNLLYVLRFFAPE